MSTVVCQGLQSCLEPQLVDTATTTTTTLRLKLVAPKSIGLSRGSPILDGHTREIGENINVGDSQMSSNLGMGGWSFLQSLSNSSQISSKAMEMETSYVHPLVKPSSLLRLSEKSLELCTESLGSETGSDTTESSIFSFSSLDSDSGKYTTRVQENSRQHIASRKEHSRNFPPPLTTISGSNSLRVRPHREGGRLIIEVVETSSTNTCFQAERSHGRLRLSFLKNYENENRENKEEYEEEFEEEEEEEYFEEEEEEESDAYVRKDIDENNVDVEVEMGIEKFQRPSRCNEGGHGDKGLYNWEPFWVATS